MPGNSGTSHPNDLADRPLKFKAYPNCSTKKIGEAMTVQAIQIDRYPTSRHAQRMQDIFLVSSFGLWAVLLGLAPVLVFRLLAGS
jgi:hypothetical protein